MGEAGGSLNPEGDEKMHEWMGIDGRAQKAFWFLVFGLWSLVLGLLV